MEFSKAHNTCFIFAVTKKKSRNVFLQFIDIFII